MRHVVAFALMLAACGGDPPCVDKQGDEVPSCEYDVPGDPEPLVYCPGDQWGAVDGCNSCACDDNGKTLCTTVTDCGGS